MTVVVGLAVAVVLAVFVAAAMASLALAKHLFDTAVDCCVCCGNGCLGGYGDFSCYSGKWHIPILRLKMAILFQFGMVDPAANCCFFCGCICFVVLTQLFKIVIIYKKLVTINVKVTVIMQYG